MLKRIQKVRWGVSFVDSEQRVSCWDDDAILFSSLPIKPIANVYLQSKGQDKVTRFAIEIPGNDFDHFEWVWCQSWKSNYAEPIGVAIVTKGGRKHTLWVDGNLTNTRGDDAND